MRAISRAGAVGLAVSLAGTLGAAEPPLGPVAWRRLEFGATKLLLSVSTTVTVERVAAARAAPALRAPAEGTALPVAGTEVLLLTFDSELPFGRHEHTTVWLEPGSGAALQGYKLVTGRKPYEKLFRYTTEGFYFWRAAPAAGGEEKLGPESWSRRRGRLVRSALPLPAGTAVTDSYALLYLASAARLERAGAGLRAVLLAEEQPVEVRFASGGLVQDRLDYRERGSDGSRRRNQQALQRVVTMSGRPLGSGAAAGGVDLGFLGLRGSVRVFLDAGTGLPVRLQGRADTIGELTVRLEAVEWAGPLPGPRDAGGGS